MPRVSVIIPTYNHRDWILATLASVFEQSFNDYEVIVVNDGSPDNTSEVLSSLRSSRQIRYIEQKNLGQSSARNRGLSEARGEYIALLDDDDLWPRDKLDWQVAALDSDSSLGAIAGRAEFIDASARAYHVSAFVPELTFETFFDGNPIMSPGQALIRRSALAEIGGLDPTIWGADDWDLWFKLSYRTQFVMHDRTALRYRTHSGNASHQLPRLFSASRAVIKRHLLFAPRERRRLLRRAAYSKLYAGWGPQLAVSLRHQLRRGQLFGAARQAVSLGAFLRAADTNPSLLYQIPMDLLPVSLRMAFRRQNL